MENKINALALGYAGAVAAGLSMLVLSILGKLGIYVNAVEAMQHWHMFYSLSFGGIIAGIIESAVVTFLFGYLIGWFYNKFVS